MKEVMIAWSIGLCVGYVASIFTWEKFTTWLIGEAEKIRAFEDKINALRKKL